MGMVTLTRTTVAGREKVRGRRHRGESLTKVLFVPPGIRPPLKRQRKFMGGLPVKPTVNVEVSPTTVACVVGWRVIAGGTPPGKFPPGVGTAASQFVGSLPYEAATVRCKDGPLPSAAKGHGVWSL